MKWKTFFKRDEEQGENLGKYYLSHLWNKCKREQKINEKYMLKAFTSFVNVFKYHFSSTDRKMSVRIKLEIIFIFRLRCHPIQLVMLVPVGLSITL